MNKNTNNINMNQLVANTLNSLYVRAESDENVASKIAAAWTVGSNLPKVWTHDAPDCGPSRILRMRVWSLLLLVVIALDRISHENRKVRWNDEHVTFLPTQCDVDGTVYDDTADEILADGSCWVDTRPERLMPVTEKTAASQMRKWKKSHDSEMIGDGAFADAVGPWTYEFTVDGEVIRLGYQGNDGRSRCPEQGCDTVLSSDGSCSVCGYSTTWTEEVKADAEHARYLDSLDRRIVASYKRAYDYERRERLGNIIRWIGQADASLLPSARSRFYKRVVASRKQCASTGLWYHSYLTRGQVDVIFAAIEWRQDGGTM